VIGRQKIVGWILVVVTAAYILYFIRVRLLVPGPVVTRSEWFNLIACVIVLMIGTINVRMAAMRARKDKEGSSR
jgi:hypothetical protein